MANWSFPNFHSEDIFSERKFQLSHCFILCFILISVTVESIWSFHLRYSLCLCEIWINLIFIFIWKLFPGIPDSWNAFLFQQIEIKWNYYVSIHMCKTIIKNYVPCKRLWPTLWLSDVIIFHFHLVLFWSGPHFFSCLQLSNLKSKVIFVMLFFLK